jgi:hypothetical protein
MFYLKTAGRVLGMHGFVARLTSHHSNASLIVVDSEGDAATRFYSKFGFILLLKLADRMFLALQTAESP